MNTKIKMFALGLIIILTGLFAGTTNTAFAEVVPTCDSATFNGYVTPNGNATSVWFEWGSTPSLGQSTTRQTFNSNSDFSQHISGLSQDTQYYYRAMAENNAGVATGSTVSFMTSRCQAANTPPTITLNGNNTVNINANQNYNDAGATAYDQEDGNITANINKTGFVNTALVGTYTLTYRVSDSMGLQATPVTRTVIVNAVAPTTCQDPNATNFNGSLPCQYGNIPNNPNPTVVLTCNSITFNGYVTPNGNATSVWFEWGSTPSLGQSTARQTFNSNSDFSQHITGLSQNTNYYYRAMAQNSVGTATGSVVSFRTSQCQVISPTVSLTVDNSNVPYNGSTTVRWTSTNATSCYGNGGSNNWATQRSIPSGSFYTGTLTGTTTFSIVCSNESGSTGDSKTITVGNQTYQPPVVGTRPPTLRSN